MLGNITVVFWSIRFAAIFARSDGIAQSARRPSGAFQSSGTSHGAGRTERSFQEPLLVSISFLPPKLLQGLLENVCL